MPATRPAGSTARSSPARSASPRQVGSFHCTFPDGPASTTSRSRSPTPTAPATPTPRTSSWSPSPTSPRPSPLPADQTANEGDDQDFNLGSFTDPGPDSPWAVSVDWGDGSTDTTFNQAAPGSLGTASHTYADGPATRTVTVTVTDGTAPATRTTFTVTVANVAPTVAFTAGPVTVNEGATEHPYSYTISDPGADTVSSVAVSCGDGRPARAGSASTGDMRAASTAPSPTARPARPSRSRRPIPTARATPRAAR